MFIIATVFALAFVGHKMATPEIRAENRAAVARWERRLVIPVVLIWAWIAFEVVRAA